MLRFEDTKNPIALHELIWSCSRQSGIFDNEYRIVPEKLPSEMRLRRAILTNLFRWNIDFLGRALDSRNNLDLYQPINISIKRLEQLRKIIESYISRAADTTSRDVILPTEVYSGLGLLSKYYEGESNIPSANLITIQRGWLRANYSELTESCFERILLKIWGLLTAFGTVISRPTGVILFLIFFTLLFVMCSLSKTDHSFLDVIHETIKLMTLKGSSKFENQQMVVFLELIFMITIPLYFGYFVTFLLRWK